MFGDPRVDDVRYSTILKDQERQEKIRRRLAEGRCPRCGRGGIREKSRCPRCGQGFR